MAQGTMGSARKAYTAQMQATCVHTWDSNGEAQARASVLGAKAERIAQS